MIDEKMLIKILSKNSIFEKITNAEGKNVFGIIENLPKFGEWIPCSERLPDIDGQYLTTSIIHYVPDHVDEPDSYIGLKITHFKRKWKDWCFMDVIAWQPLPEAYKGEQE